MKKYLKKLRNVVLEKNIDDQLERSCEKLRCITYKVNKERNILQMPKRRKANWICHILRRNCILKRVIERKIEGRIEVKGRGGRRPKQHRMTLRKREITVN